MNLRWTAIMIIVLVSVLANHGEKGSAASSTNNNRIWIIETVEGKPPKQVLERLISQYGEIERRYVFEEVWRGFSAVASEAVAQKLKSDSDVLAIRESGLIKTAIKAEKRGQPLSQQQPDQAKSLTGKGIKIGVIDTGIDYRHPDLKENFIGGYDLVDDDPDPMETKGRKATIHGTHVAGIIGANGKMKGVAPGVKLYAYRALGPGGTGTTDQVIAAIERAVKDKMDIINLSLGDNLNGADLPTSKAIDRAVEKGITAVVANGNDGPGLWSIGSPGTSSRAISVGASAASAKVPYVTVAFEQQSVRVNTMEGSPEWNFSHSKLLVDGGIGQKETLNRKTCAGKLVLMKRGTIPFKEKVANAYSAGAVGVLIYNNEPGAFNGSLAMKAPIPVAALPQQVGDEFKKRLKKKKELAVTTSVLEETEKLADFSSRGPVLGNIAVKPDLIAPGVKIVSTIPGASYMRLQGTSMAAPYIAGVCALIKEAHPEWSPEQIKSVLMTTAKPLMRNKWSSYDTYEQGAGLVNKQEAVNEETFLSPSSITFGLVEKGRMHTSYIMVENNSKNAKKYSFEQPDMDAFVSWSLPLSFTLKPGEQKRVPIHLHVGKLKEETALRNGYLQLNDGKRDLSIPYQFALKEPEYPLADGFSAEQTKEGIKLDLYVPKGADSIRYTLLDANTLLYQGELGSYKQVEKGMHTVTAAVLPKKGPGHYVILAEIKKGDEKNTLNNFIFLDNQVE